MKIRGKGLVRASAGVGCVLYHLTDQISFQRALAEGDLYQVYRGEYRVGFAVCA